VALKGNRGLYPARIIYEVAERNDFEVIELGATADLVHLFASAPPDMAPAKIM
jgi:REP element-mobilizing transposase RayT